MSASHSEMLIEPIAVTDTFASGAIEAEDLGDAVRLTFFSRQRSHFSAAIERVIVARIVMTTDSYSQYRSMITAGDLGAAKRPTAHRIGGLQ